MKLHKSMPPALLASALALALCCAPYLNYQHKAEGEFRKGDYDAAVYDAAASLRYNPAGITAQLMIDDAYRASLNTHHDRIKDMLASAARHKWDGIVAEYAELQFIGHAVRDLPTLPNKAAPGGIVRIAWHDFSDSLLAAQRNAAETHYREGTRLSASNDVEAQKQAAIEFRTADSYVPGYKDAADRFARSKSAGTLRVAIVPFEDKSGQTGAFGALTDKIADDIISEVMNDAQATEFLEFISRDRLEQVLREQQLEVSGLVDLATAQRIGKLLGAHDILTGRITQIFITPERTVSRTQDQQATVVVGKRTVTDSAGSHDVDIQATVSAHVTIYTKTAAASVAGAYSILDVGTGAVKKTQSFENRKDFSGDWATCTGDQRALGDLADLCNRSEPAAPSQAELVSDAAKDLSHALADGLKQFFK